MLNVSEVVLSWELAEPFLVKRSKGKFVPGGWQDEKVDVPMYGIVSTASAMELQTLPEGDRVQEARIFYSTKKIHVTNVDDSGTSDIVIWHGTSYRVLSVGDFSHRGYWRAMAVRMSGT